MKTERNVSKVKLKNTEIDTSQIMILRVVEILNSVMIEKRENYFYLISLIVISKFRIDGSIVFLVQLTDKMMAQ